jgi:hypothetical protein
MKNKLPNLPRLILIAILFSIPTHLRAEDCLSGLPDALKSAVEQDHWKIVSPFDIPSDDWKLWKNAHQGECPGVAVGNFTSKEPAYVVALTLGDDPKNLLEKVVFVSTKKGQPITEIVVSPTQVTTPSVVWKLSPGHYAAVDGKHASISKDSFVYEKIAGSATQFYHQGNKFESLLISR